VKKLVLAVAALAISTVAAAAADLAPRPYTKAPMMAIDPAYDWSGFYVGGHVGYLWGRTRVIDDGVLTEPGAPTNGAVGGVLAGYNWQFSGPFVVGIEGDFGWTNAHGHGLPTPPPPIIIITTTQAPNAYDLNWTSHVVGKVGYASGSWLFFATGGLSIADLNFREGAITTTTTILGPPVGGKYFGFSLGAGVEHAFTRNLLGRLQYIYDDFGSKNYFGADGGIYRVSLTSQTLRGALSWKF
jgi:outer membrane immunogenic protein